MKNNELFIEIIRLFDSGVQTEGVLYLLNSKKQIIFESKTLELPWRNNEKRISCIPAGKYVAKTHSSPKFGRSLWLQDVEDRSEILVHVGNYHTDILGCILVGNEFRDINKDGQMDVLNSRNTMNEILKLIGSQKEIEIDIRYRY